MENVFFIVLVAMTADDPAARKNKAASTQEKDHGYTLLYTIISGVTRDFA